MYAATAMILTLKWIHPLKAVVQKQISSILRIIWFRRLSIILFVCSFITIPNLLHLFYN